MSRPAPPLRMSRVDTLGLKDTLDAALPPDRAPEYWATLTDFVDGRLSRAEFEELALRLLPAEQIAVHNELVVGLLYNASPGVPGPTLAHRFASGRTFADGDWDDDRRPPPHKRLRTMVAGLTNRERAALKAVGGRRAAGSIADGSTDPSLVWAGEAAEVLERKRRDDERRRQVEEKKRFRETRSSIGARDWLAETRAGHEFVDATHGRLPASVQQCLQRATVAPHCLTAKELPDTDTLRDRMTLVAVKHGLTQGVHPQAASMLLLALQDHLQTLASLTLRKLRPPSSATDGEQPPGPGGSSRGIALPDLDYTLDQTPASVVEPLGLGPSERLAMPDWAEEEQVERETTSVHAKQVASVARTSTVAKLPGSKNAARARFAIDTLAPARLFARDVARDEPSPVQAQEVRPYLHLQEVIDPVALLDSL